MPDANQFTTDIIADTQRQLELNRSAGKVILENASEIQNTLRGIGSVYDIVSADMATVKNAETAARLTSQTALAAVANGFGVQITNPANRLVQLATEKTVADKEAVVKLDELNRRATKTPSDGILDYIGNQIFGVYDARQAYRAAAGKANLLDSQIKDVNSNIQQTATTYKALEESVTAASADAASRIAASDAMIKAKTVKLEGLKYDTEAITRYYSLSKDVVDAGYQALNARRQEESLKISQEHLKISREAFEFSKEERVLTREARQEGKELDENIVENINLGRASLGLSPFTGVEAKQQLSLFKQNKQELFDMFRRGEEVKRSGRAVIGLTPADAIKNLSENPTAERTLPEIKTPVIQLLNRARQKTAADPQLDRKDARAVELNLNKNVAAEVKQQYERADSGPDNIFNPGDLKQYLGNEKTGIPAPNGISNLSLYKKLFRPLADSGVDMSQPKMVYAMTYEALKEGKITFEDAIELSKIYRSANDINQIARGLGGFGIVPPNNGKTLNVSIGKYGTVLDITNPVVLSRKLAAQLTFDKYGIITPGMISNPTAEP